MNIIVFSGLINRDTVDDNNYPSRLLYMFSEQIKIMDPINQSPFIGFLNLFQHSYPFAVTVIPLELTVFSRLTHSASLSPRDRLIYWLNKKRWSGLVNEKENCRHCHPSGKRTGLWKTVCRLLHYIEKGTARRTYSHWLNIWCGPRIHTF